MTKEEMLRAAVIMILAAVGLLLMNKQIWALSEATGVTRTALTWTAVAVIIPVTFAGVKLWTRWQNSRPTQEPW